MVEERNKEIRYYKNSIIQVDFAEYTDGLLNRMWHYAKLSGLKEYNHI